MAAALGDSNEPLRDASLQLQLEAVTRETSRVAKLSPFIEQMGTGVGAGYDYRKESWWEREWRKVGNLWFRWEDGRVFAPELEHDVLAAAIDAGRKVIEEDPPFLDPRWGLEHMIAALRGSPPADVGPFP